MISQKSHNLGNSTAARWVRLTAAACLTAVVILFATAAEATPAYARRYNLTCQTCHAPLPPRLNNVGILFRKLGFRMPDADEQGRFMIKAVASHNIGEAASLVANVSGRRDSDVEPSAGRSTFELGELEVVAGTAIGNRVSVQAMFLPWMDGKAELENAEVQYNAGSPRHQLVARGGYMQNYLWQKAAHGALTLSKPLVFDEGAVKGVGPFEGFGIGASQIGAELGYLYTRLQNGRVSSTMITAALLNGVTREGEPALRNTTSGADFYIQGLQLMGNRNTIGGFYYRGRSSLAGSDPEPPIGSQHRFERYGAFGNVVALKRFDLVAGGAFGRDRSLFTDGKNVRFGGLFTEVDAELRPAWVAVYRFDLVDPDRDEARDTSVAHTVSSTVCADEHLYLTGEYQRRRSVTGVRSWAFIANARLVF